MRLCSSSCWRDGMREKSSANSSLRGPEKALQAPSALVAAVSSSAAPSFTQPLKNTPGFPPISFARMAAIACLSLGLSQEATSEAVATPARLCSPTLPPPSSPKSRAAPGHARRQAPEAEEHKP